MSNLLEELVRYTEFHFYSEELLMSFYDYTEIEDHKMIHINLIEDLTNNRLLIESGDLAFDDFLSFVVDWFFNHTVEYDGQFSHQIRQQEKYLEDSKYLLNIIPLKTRVQS